MKEQLKIYIRPLVLEDAKTSYRWRNAPEIWRFTGKKPTGIVTYEIEHEWLQNSLRDDSCKRFAICCTDTKQYIGNVQLTNIDNIARTAIFHIFIGEKKYWGKGIATQATLLLLKYAKTELKLFKITLNVNQNNLSAITVYRKSGFKPIETENHNSMLKMQIIL